MQGIITELRRGGGSLVLKAENRGSHDNFQCTLG